MTLLLEVDALEAGFDTRHGRVRAVDGVSFVIARGETLGLVGESGCGKSTLGRALMGLVPTTGGTVRLEGRDITHLSRRERRPVAREVQIVFQDPVASLNPRKRIARIVEEPLLVHGIGNAAQRSARVIELLARVGLEGAAAQRFPHEFSGGQRQRIGIARALALDPALLICDEPVSALDLSVQAQVLNLFTDLQASLGLAYLFISHDLAVIRHVAKRVAVMYLGKIVEIGDAQALFERPGHPYTRALIAAAPPADLGPANPAETAALDGDVPSPLEVPSGCRFHPRCPIAVARCRTEEPLLVRRADGRASACHLDAG